MRERERDRESQHDAVNNNFSVYSSVYIYFTQQVWFEKTM